jgi:hypothetical protein
MDLEKCQKCEFFSGRELLENVLTWGLFCVHDAYFSDAGIIRLDDLAKCPLKTAENADK